MSLNTHAAQLAAITSQMKTLEAEAKEVKSQMLDEMKAQNLTNFKSDFGTVSKVTRKKYTYSDEVATLEDQVKLKKVEEEERGLAQVSVTEYVQIKLADHDKE